jgi:hypothetical protein
MTVPLKEAWRKLYKAALFETDKRKAAERISNAEHNHRPSAKSLLSSGQSPDPMQFLECSTLQA